MVSSDFSACDATGALPVPAVAAVLPPDCRADCRCALEQRLERAERESRRARFRQWRFEQAALHKLSLLAAPLPTKLNIVEGSPEILGHLDIYQLWRDAAEQYYLYLKGWAWSLSSTVIAVDLFVDGARWLQLDYGDQRSDVRRHFSAPEEMESCGFGDCVALPESFRADATCLLQVCDLEGRWKRFEISPAENPAARAGETPAPQAATRWRQRLEDATYRRRIARLVRRVRRRANLRFARADTLCTFISAIGDGAADDWSACIDSLRSQVTGHWELLLAPTSAEGQAAAGDLLRRYRRDRRIASLPEVADCAGALNQAVRRARGRFVSFLDADVRTAPDAVTWASLTVAERPDAAWLYTDGAAVGPTGEFRESDHKPDFSALHLWSRFFTRGLSLYDREVLIQGGGLRAGAAGGEEYDLALRLARRLRPAQIVHLPEVLFHRCDRADLDGGPRPCDVAGVQVAQRALQEAGLSATVQPHPCGREIRRIELAPRETPSVLIVIPTRDKAALLRRCVESLRAATRYPNYRVLVIDNGSTERALAEFLEENRRRADFSWVTDDRPFNHSLMHNDVLARADAEFAVLLNNDVAGFSAGWLEQLVAVAEIDPRIAGVGPLLVYPDRRVQHGGVVPGLRGGAAHAHLDLPSDLPGYQGRLHCLQDASACTAACLLIRLSAFREVGGFRAEEFPAAFNDVDLWLRLGDAGYRCAYQPAVSAVHYESASRGITAAENEAADRLRVELARRDYRDPFFNPHLDPDCERFRDRSTPRAAREAQWERLLAAFEETP